MLSVSLKVYASIGKIRKHLKWFFFNNFCSILKVFVWFTAVSQSIIIFSGVPCASLLNICRFVALNLCPTGQSGGTAPIPHRQTISMSSTSTHRRPPCTWPSSSRPPAPTTSSTSSWPHQRACWRWVSSGASLWSIRCSPCPNGCTNRCWAPCCERPWPCWTPWRQVRAGRGAKANITQLSQFIWRLVCPPPGRIMNRFTKDMATIDDMLPLVLFDLIQVGVIALLIAL